MKLLKIVCILALIVGLSSVGFAEEVKRVAKVIEMEGSVEAKLMPEKAWVPVGIGTTLQEGDIIKTKANSWALLNINGTGQTATVEVKEGSQLMLTELVMDEEEGTQQTLLDLAIGKVLIKAQKLHSEDSRFEVKTPTSIVGVRGTTFSVEVEAVE